MVYYPEKIKKNLIFFANIFGFLKNLSLHLKDNRGQQIYSYLSLFEEVISLIFTASEQVVLKGCVYIGLNG